MTFYDKHDSASLKQYPETLKTEDVLTLHAGDRITVCVGNGEGNRKVLLPRIRLENGSTLNECEAVGLKYTQHGQNIVVRDLSYDWLVVVKCLDNSIQVLDNSELMLPVHKVRSITITKRDGIAAGVGYQLIRLAIHSESQRTGKSVGFRLSTVALSIESDQIPVSPDVSADTE